MKITRVHHLTLAVRDVEAARRTFEQIFGAQALDGPAPVPAFGVRAVDLALGDSALELVAPAGSDNPLMRFLERRGEGFYTLALEVDDLDAAVAELAARGVRVSEPVEAKPGLRSAFITMAATHGLSVQLVQVLRDEPPPPAPAPQPAAPPVAEEPAATPADDAPPPLDLSPDEWSDVD
jgi:methylmalonyl-CoA/ethylmalonyl-CoA epimerase